MVEPSSICSGFECSTTAKRPRTERRSVILNHWRDVRRNRKPGKGSYATSLMKMRDIPLFSLCIHFPPWYQLSRKLLLAKRTEESYGQLKKARASLPSHLLYHLCDALQGLLALLRDRSVGLENMVHLFPYL